MLTALKTQNINPTSSMQVPMVKLQARKVEKGCYNLQVAIAMFLDACRRFG